MVEGSSCRYGMKNSIINIHKAHTKVGQILEIAGPFPVIKGIRSQEMDVIVLRKGLIELNAVIHPGSGCPGFVTSVVIGRQGIGPVQQVLPECINFVFQ